MCEHCACGGLSPFRYMGMGFWLCRVWALRQVESVERPLLSVAVWKKAPLYWCSTMSLWGDHFQGCTSSFSDGSTSSAVEQYYLLTCPFFTYFHSLNKENTFILLINFSILTQRKVKLSIILLEKKLVGQDKSVLDQKIKVWD